jgi:hypothetical protein
VALGDLVEALQPPNDTQNASLESDNHKSETTTKTFSLSQATTEGKM